jgi:hypothetical protein
MHPNLIPFLLVIFLSWIQFDPTLRLAIATAGQPPNGRSSLNVFFTILMVWVGNLSCGRVMMGGKDSKMLFCLLFLAMPRPVRRTRGATGCYVQAHLLEVRGAFEIDIINVVSAFCLCSNTSLPPQSEHTNATTLGQNSLNKTAKAAAARQQCLEAAEQGMGLSMPGRGIQAPTLVTSLILFRFRHWISWDRIPCL